MVHGDAVLTNVIVCGSRVRFVDMRGLQGDVLCVWGDATYDYAKVAQSLLGYDYLLVGGTVDRERMEGLVRVLKGFLEGVEWMDVLLVAWGLVVSCIGMHEDEGRRRRLAGMARGLLKVVEGRICSVQEVVGIVLEATWNIT